ncbi:MAG TPA: GNAT family N-acetyltransferase [Terriglobales bacterium]|jgi:CelD/BcsL family acetyltransferase involved in cellulose biosynthesis
MSSSSENIQVALLKSIEGEDALREEWNQLVSRAEIPQIFLTFEWALAVERAFPFSLEPWIFILRKKNVLIGCAALASCPGEHNKIFFLGASTGDYCDIVSAPNDRGVVVTAILGALHDRRVREIDLTNIPAESATVKVISQSGHSNYRSSSRPAYTCSRIILDGERRIASSSEVLPEISQRLMKDEQIRRLSKLGPLKLVHVRDNQGALRALDSVIKAQVSRFLATSRLSPLLLATRRRFLVELKDLLSQKDWLDISVLKVADHDVAWNFGFVFHGVCFWYLPTFDLSMESFSPGMCLLKLMMEESAHKLEIKEIDLGLGDENYKRRVANDSRKTLTLTLSSSLATHLGGTIARVLARGFKAWGPIERAVRDVLRTGTRVKQSVVEKRVGNGVKMLLGKILSKIFLANEIALFEWSESSTGRSHSVSPSFRLAQMTWDGLAETAMQHSDDPDALEYLKRSARRLRSSKRKDVQGYVLVSETGEELHYLWAADFSGFQLSEIHYSLQPIADASMIFDCWTPKPLRSKHYYRIAVECLGQELRRQQRSAWIFSGKRNLPSLRALQNSRFEYRYSLLRRKFVYQMPVEKLRIIDMINN